MHRVTSRRSFGSLFPLLKEQRPLSTMQTAVECIKPHPIPRLNVIDDIIAACRANQLGNSMEGTILIGRQHILETTGTILREWGGLGLDPNDVFVLGKRYSTSPAVETSLREEGFNVFSEETISLPGEYGFTRDQAIERLWDAAAAAIRQKKFKRCIILDDGGLCIQNASKYAFREIKTLPTAAIEQTRAGLYNSTVQRLLYPLIDVAMSAAKRCVEPPMISRAILTRTKQFMHQFGLGTDSKIGIIGAGAIGMSMTRELIKDGFQVFIYDENETAFHFGMGKGIHRVNSVETLISNTDCIFGLTGNDCTRGIGKQIIQEIRSKKIFISGSSEDVEFNELMHELLQMKPQNENQTPTSLFDTVCRRNQYGAPIMILEGGLPYNFNRQPWNVPAQDIAMTQGLLFTAGIQATLAARKLYDDGHTVNTPLRLMLNPTLQQFVVSSWQHHRHPEAFYSTNFFQKFGSLKWITTHSGGTFVPDARLQTAFHADVEPMTLRSESCCRV